jgi:hypothetical protein
LLDITPHEEEEGKVDVIDVIEVIEGKLDVETRREGRKYFVGGSVHGGGIVRSLIIGVLGAVQSRQNTIQRPVRPFT